MKNFFKKLSFVLAIAMVLTSLTPATASAAAKNYVKNQNGKTVTTQYVYMGGKTVTLTPYLNGKVAKSGVTITSSKKTIATVNKKGEIKPLKNGTTVVTFKSGKTTIGKVSVKVRTRAKSLNIYDKAEYKAGNKTKLTEVTLKAGEKKDLQITMPMYKSAVNAGAVRASYFTYAEVEGSAVKVTKGSTQRAFTLEAVEAGTAKVTIVANQTTQKNVRKNDYYVEASFNVKVTDQNVIASAKAAKVNKVEVTFAAPVDKDTVVTVTKNGNAVEGKNEFSEDFTKAIYTTTAKMTNGTYEVAVSGASIQDKASFTVESQKVAEIQILNDVALTGSKDVSGSAVEGMQAYVYYKVVDQYGEDLTASTSIQWSSSCGDPKIERAEGRLIFERTDGKAFTFNEQLFVTGVYTKTGVSVQKTLTIGAAQALHEVEIVGFVAKNGTEIKDTLPVGFKKGEYYMLYNVKDQNGNALKPNGKITSSDVTLISDNVLIVKDFDFVKKSVVVNGVEYNAVEVNPGDFVDKGGDFTVTAIAAKTGNTSKKAFNVGQNAILDSFVISDPGVVVSDGEKNVKLPFTATDTNGNAITKFTTLADNLNKLSFSVTDGDIKLKENNDGTATLLWSDKTVAWTEGTVTDNVARPISITTIVVGGKSDTFMLSVEDKARPDAIYEVTVDNEDRLLPEVLVEGDSVSIHSNDFGYLDQYGRKMLNSAGKHTDNGFFAASAADDINGVDFKGYTYDIMAEYKGSDNTVLASSVVNATTTKNIMGVRTGTANDIDAGKTINSVNAGNILVFSIARKKGSAEWEKTSTDFNSSLTVVDITQVKNFEVEKLNKQYLPTNNSTKLTGDGLTITDVARTGAVPETHQQTIKVSGTYNGVSVKVPSQYFTSEGIKLEVAGNVIVGASGSVVKWSDLYDATTARYTRKDTSDVVTVKVYAVYATNGAITTAGTISANLLDSVKATVTVSDAAPYVAKINAVDAWTPNPTTTEFAMSTVDHDPSWKALVEDQYTKAITPEAISYLVNGVKEAEGYATNNFKVVKNDTDAASVEGAERGDAFTLTITAVGGGNTVTKTVKVTVGADSKAYLTKDTNVYVDVLKKVLEKQREESLQ